MVAVRHLLVRLFGRGVVILAISGLAGAALVRLAPGFERDERALDPRFSANTLDTIARVRAAEKSPLPYYAGYLGGLLRGDAGHSIVFGQPVGPLIRERLPVTLQSVTEGLLLGWSSALILGAAASLSRRKAVLAATTGITGALLSVPSAVLATVCLLFAMRGSIAIAAVVFPRVCPHAYEQLRSSLRSPHVVMARARGLHPARLFWFYVAPAALPPLAALAAVSVSLACGASIAIEALSDSPGIGQLAWRAALGRDLPVLVAVTLLLTAITVLSNIAAELALLGVQRRSV